MFFTFYPPNKLRPPHLLWTQNTILSILFSVDCSLPYFCTFYLPIINSTQLISSPLKTQSSVLLGYIYTHKYIITPINWQCYQTFTIFPESSSTMNCTFDIYRIWQKSMSGQSPARGWHWHVSRFNKRACLVKVQWDLETATVKSSFLCVLLLLFLSPLDGSDIGNKFCLVCLCFSP